MGRQRAELWHNGVLTPMGVMVDKRCCFGDAAAATKCVRISNVVARRIKEALGEVDKSLQAPPEIVMRWVASRLAAGGDAQLHWAGQYMDDIMGSSFNDLAYDHKGQPVVRNGIHVSRALLHFEAAKKVVCEFGWESEPSKEHPPAAVIESLGVVIDVLRQVIYLGERKRDKYSAQIRLVIGATSVPWRMFHGLLGRLTFASICVPTGLQHLHACWRLSRVVFRTSDNRVLLSDRAKEELEWWISKLRSAESCSTSLAKCDPFPSLSEGTCVVYADASSTYGFCAWSVKDGCLFLVEGQWNEEEKNFLRICDMELLASTYGIMTFSDLIDRYVLSFTDNTVTRACIENQGSKSEILHRILKWRNDWLSRRGIVERAYRVTSADNVWADLGSRGELHVVISQAKQLGLSVQLRVVPDSIRDTSYLRNIFH